MMERYLYSVTPKRPIKNLSADIPILRVPKTLRLAKGEVESCLKCAIVYRRFANESRLERVTPLTLDRLHNAKYMTEEEYQEFLEAQIDSKNGTVINASIDVPVVEPAPEVDEQSVQHVIAPEQETPVVVKENEVVEKVAEDSEKTVEIEDAEQSVDETVTDETEVEEDAVDGTVEDETEVEEVKEETTATYNNDHKNKNYYGGKNRRK